MEQSTLTVGIDIGWSERKRSCAFAANDPKKKIIWPAYSSTYENAKSCCTRFRLTELITFLSHVREAMKSYDQTIVVLDGPLGPMSKPKSAREVDSLFRMGQFKKRMQPTDVNTELGEIYVDATYQVLNALCGGEEYSLWTHGEFGSNVVVAETNPTVGLALLNRKVAPANLPSRKHPLLSIDPKEGAIRAKSDYYWKAGGNLHCAAILKDPTIAAENNHENVAGIYCLAVARSIAEGKAISCGNIDTGVYVFPSIVDPDWHNDLQGTKIVHGHIVLLDRFPEAELSIKWRRVQNERGQSELGNSNELDTDSELAFRGDTELLLLNDNGGIWERHNTWLKDFGEPIKLLEIHQSREIILRRAANETQWTSTPTALQLARGQGFEHAHLSANNCVSVEVEILG